MSAAQRAQPVEISPAEHQAIGQAMEAGVALHRRGLLDDAERPSENQVLRQWKDDAAVTIAVRETPSGAFALIRDIL